MSSTNEPFSRIKIDRQLADAGWNLIDQRSVRYEYILSDGTRADYVLCDARGQALAVVEAKRSSRALGEGEAQAVAYAKLLDIPFVFLANGEEVRFRDLNHDAHFRVVDTIFGQDDLERRRASSALRVSPTTIALDGRIAGREYQRACIDVLCRSIEHGQRKLLVEMATGTGKTRMAAALIKRLFDAHWVTRVLFLVDRATLATQTEEAFTENLTTLSTYRVPRTGERFKPEKQITICTLQTMINEYRNYSSGYFDLIVIDECHRSIYGEFRRVLDHFDAVKVGLTATPLVAKLSDDIDPDDVAFIRDTLRFFELATPTYRYTLSEAIEDGYLVPYHIYRAQTVKTAAEGGFEVAREEIDWDALDAETRGELEEHFGDKRTILVDPSALERRFTIPERNRAIVREFRNVLDHGFTASNGRRLAPMLGKTIVFAVTKRHAETLARMLDDAFADKKPTPSTRYADFVVSGMGSEDSADGPTLIKRFKREPFPQILVSVNMLDTGFDCPEVVNLVMARFTKSAVLYQQMRGRGTRKATLVRKDAFTIFDFVGVCEQHEGDSAPEGGIVVQTPRPVEPPKPRRLLTLDIHDEIDPTTRDFVTVDANGAVHVASAEEARADRLGVLFEAFLAGEKLTLEQTRLANMIGEQIKALAADIVAFTPARFTKPPFSLWWGLSAVQAAFGGDAEMRAFLARLNEAVFKEEAPKGQGERRAGTI